MAILLTISVNFATLAMLYILRECLSMFCKLFRLSVAFCFCLLTFFPQSSRAAENSSVSDEQLNLSLHLLKAKMKNAKGNFVLSPMSVYMATDLLANGAGGETLKKLQKLILSPLGNVSLTEINQAISEYMQNLSPAIKINNSVWGNDFRPEYIQSVEALGAESHDLPQNTQTINEWIENKTKGKIKNVLQPQATDIGDFYLVNTVYFNDKWENIFVKQATKLKPFYDLDAAKPTSVYMMYNYNGAEYYENDKFQAIRMRYQRYGKVRANHIDIILPREGIDFRKFVSSLKLQELKVPYNSYDDSNIDVRIYLPRFEVNYKTPLNAWFKAGGIPLFREDNPDLSAMSNIPHYVKNIIHQANIRVDEEGTEAAAATVFEGAAYGAMMPRERQEKIFNANRPFIFILNDGLFIGAFIKGGRLEAK